MSGKCQKFQKIQVRSTGVRRKFFLEGKLDILLILSMLLMMQCKYTITKHLPFLHHHENAPCYAGRNEGCKGEQFPGPQITMGAPNHCGGTIKSQQCHKYFLQYGTFASERAQVRTWGRQTSFLPQAPSSPGLPDIFWSLLAKIIINYGQNGYFLKKLWPKIQYVLTMVIYRLL